MENGHMNGGAGIGRLAQSLSALASGAVVL